MIYAAKEYFNSIKVRLKRSRRWAVCSSSVFQFHKGTIKTGCRYGFAPVCSNFNSIKVRLKPPLDCGYGMPD